MIHNNRSTTIADMTNDPLQPLERPRAFTHRIRDHLLLRNIRLGKMRMWLFLLVVVFVIGILVFGIPKP